jgi:hypothetical protein
MLLMEALRVDDLPTLDATAIGAGQSSASTMPTSFYGVTMQVHYGVTMQGQEWTLETSLNRRLAAMMDGSTRRQLSSEGRARR